MTPATHHQHQRTALVTGASSGIGRAVAVALAGRGHTVIGTSRDPDAIPAEARVPSVRYLPLDCEDGGSIEALAEAAGEVDVLVNNAGESQVGALEEIPEEAVRRLFELNVFAPLFLTQLLLPGMRDRGYGRVVMIGSMQSSFPLAFRSSYGASKSAIKGFADGCRHELSPFGVWVTTVEPGGIRTGISARRTRYQAEGSPYAEPYRRVSKALDAGEDRGVAPERVAATVVKAIEADRPRPLYAVGSSAPLAFAMQRILPRAVAEKIIGRRYGVKIR
jgi:short-subunit dehydrogenase